MSTKEKKTIVRRAKTSLKTLQHTSDRENLVGRPAKNLKHQLNKDIQLSQKTSVSVTKKKNRRTKETQVNLDTKITVDDLTNPERASENYWKILAEKRQIALQEALEENAKLHKMIEDLKQENVQYKQMLDEANSFVEVIKEQLENDTGIDVNDISTADETIEEDTNHTEHKE